MKKEIELKEPMSKEDYQIQVENEKSLNDGSLDKELSDFIFDYDLEE